MPAPVATRTTALGNVQVRDVEGQPARFEGMAVPYGEVINAAYGKETFVRGAFAEAARAINSGERIAYLNKHGADGGVPIGAIDTLQERDDGLHFAGAYWDMPEAVQSRQQVASGINGASIEFVPGQYRQKRGVVEHYAGVRLAAVAGSYAPAYRQARVALRSVARATGGTMPALATSALTDRRSAIASQIAVIRQLAEGENRSLDEGETTEVDTLTARLGNIDALIADAGAEAQRRDAERNALPQQRVGSPAIVTRAEPVYGPQSGQSFFHDMMTRDAAGIERLTRHRSLVTDLAQQMDRATDSSDLQAAYPTQYFPDLYVPDVAMTGPLSAFFASTTITAPLPIVIPAFDTVTGDTAVQTAENLPVANIDVATKPLTLTPKTIGGESVVSRQAVDGASPGTDVIIGTQLRELLMRDTEREIAAVLAALTSSGSITDSAGTAGAGADLHDGIAGVLAEYYAGATAGGAGARFLPAEGVFLNSTDWNNLVHAKDDAGRSLLAYINPTNAMGQVTGVGFQRGVIGGVPVEPAWAITSETDEIVARRNDARQWKSAVLDVRLMEREGPQSVVFAIWQYFGFAILEPKGVRRYTYTNV